ncbi:MAG: PP2C family protein-serine/threonine phosphatase [Chloroflexota bacterium]
MVDLFTYITKKLWPGLETLPDERQQIGISEVITFLYTTPLAIAGLIWLASTTDWSNLGKNIAFLLVHALFLMFFNRFKYFVIIELRTDRYGSSEGTLTNIILWSTTLLIGPSALWLAVAWTTVLFIRNWIGAKSVAARWPLLRNLTTDLATNSFVFLLSLSLYQAIGGSYPPKTLEPILIIQLFGVMTSFFVFSLVLWLGYMAFGVGIQKRFAHSNPIRPLVTFFALALSLPHLVSPFAIISSSLYAQSGIFAYLFFLSGFCVIALATHQLSWAAETSRVQSRALEKLEKLGRNIINSFPDRASLQEILQENVANMFPSGFLAIWTVYDELLRKQPDYWEAEIEKILPWAMPLEEARCFTANETLPWEEEGKKDHNPIILAPIQDSEGETSIGFIYLELRLLAQPWTHKALQNLLPAVQALASLITSADHQAHTYSQNLEYQRLTQELKLAARIQYSLLPSRVPTIPGWQLAVTFDPVGETSGDFFDIIPLSEGRIGLVVADVADKGFGPALFMAISRTLLRTYAYEFETQPEMIIRATNERILRDSRAGLFVTVFFSILDQETRTLSYANAGHHPPILHSAHNQVKTQVLMNTGIPVGIDEKATWGCESVKMFPGDLLVLYTDGLTDAQNAHGKFYGQENLIYSIIENHGKPADEVQKNILDSVYQFTSEAPQFDDITLMVLCRNFAEEV